MTGRYPIFFVSDPVPSPGRCHVGGDIVIIEPAHHYNLIGKVKQWPVLYTGGYIICNLQSI